MDSIALYHKKSRQLPAPACEQASQDASCIDLTFNLELEHRVWLARFKVERRDPAGTDPARLDWDAYEPDLCLPDIWQPSWLATEAHFGGRWSPNEFTASDGTLPIVGDRVVAYRTGSHGDVVGVWLITGASYGPNGALRFSHRPLVSCLEPVLLRPEVRYDADLAECWASVFGRSSRQRGSFFPLEGPALSAVMRTVGIDPQLLCGPAANLPDCSMSNVRPGAAYRPATYLRTDLSVEARAERRALAEAIDWLRTDWFRTETFGHIETIAAHGDGVCLVARADDHVAEVVALGLDSSEFDDLTLCPTLIMEAANAVEAGRDWNLIVTLDALGAGRTLRFDARAVALCFDPASGRVNTAK